MTTPELELRPLEDVVPSSFNEDEHEERRHVLGGTDMAAILGVNPWRTPLQVFREKTGRGEPVVMNELMANGLVSEEKLAKVYEMRTGNRTQVWRPMVKAKDLPIGVHLDRVIVDAGGNLEIKTASSDQGWGEEGSDQIPLHYRIQIETQMLCSGKSFTDLIVEFGRAFHGPKIRIYRIKSDPKVRRVIKKEAEKFWSEHVLADEPPAPVEGEAKDRWNKVLEGKTPIEASERDLEILNALTRLAKAKAMLVEQEKKLTHALQLRIEDAPGLVYRGEKLVTWTDVAGRKSLDRKRLEADHPELAKEYIKVGKPGRRFTNLFTNKALKED